MRENKEYNFCIKNRYALNLNPNTKFLNQYVLPDVYELAYYLAERSGSKYIVDIGGGMIGASERLDSDIKIIVISLEKDHYYIQSNDMIDIIECDLEMNFPIISDEVWINSVVICSNILERLLNPGYLLRILSKISEQSNYLLICTPDRISTSGIENEGPPCTSSFVREWQIEEFNNLLKEYEFNPFMIGYTANENLSKKFIIALSGKLNYVRQNRKVKTLAVINVYNEVDIIGETIDHLLNQGIDVKIVDNWSNDGSYELASYIARKYTNVTVERFPNQSTEFYEWTKLLENVEKISRDSSYDWVLHYDADELRYSPWKDVTLSEAISFVDSMGFNAIDFTILDFRPVHGQEEVVANYGENLVFFEFGKRPGHFIQIKGWKNTGDRINLTESGGHEAKFFNRKVFPIKFITKHFPLRNPDQARKKVFKDRQNRISPEEKAKGWHVQYNHFSYDDEFLWSRTTLTPWNQNVFDLMYIIERISGIGIVR